MPLLEEMMEEILSRLPVKSVLRFRCVSKPWLSLISTERFIDAHRQNSIQNRYFSHHKVIFQFEGIFMEYYAHELFDKASSIKPSRIHDLTKDTTNNHFLRGAFVVGCCNGLICLLSQKGLFLSLWNPATVIFMELPNLKFLALAKVGFGWDGRSGAYKVFASSTLLGGNVYSSKTNSWKKVEHGCLSVYDLNGAFACGKIHWLIQDEYIECWDLESEEFGRIKLPFQPPPEFTSPSYKMAEIGGCLHFLCVYVNDHDRQLYAAVWVMKEESGWLELFTCPLGAELSIRPDSVFGGGPNGEIFLVIHDSILVYDGKDVTVLSASKNIKYFRQGRVYVESLVSPNFTTAC